MFRNVVKHSARLGMSTSRVGMYIVLSRVPLEAIASRAPLNMNRVASC